MHVKISIFDALQILGKALNKSTEAEVWIKATAQLTQKQKQVVTL